MHGGGPQINKQLDRLGLESHFTAGLRVTTDETMDVVRMVLAGQVQRELVGLLNRHGPHAVGMTGEDARLMTAGRAYADIDGERVDIGRVGEITGIDAGVVKALLDDGRIPVVSSIARSTDDADAAEGGVYNVNADTAAAALAAALDAEILMILTDVEGLYRDWPHSDEVISRLTGRELQALLPELASGMIPKMRGCLHAVSNGVRSARVIDGRVRHSVLLEIFTDEGIGTMVVPDAGRRRGRVNGLTGNAGLTRRWQGAMMDNFGTPRLPLVRGEGTRVWDADGREYLDLLGGIAVNSLGHAHPAVVQAVAHQVSALGHVSNFFVAEPTVALAERLLGLTGRTGRVYFANSGAEANEAAFKIGRLTGRTRMVAARGGFHGRTMGALSLTGQSAKRVPFYPLPGDVTFVPYGDTRALRAAVTDNTALVILEPIQGEAGVLVPPAGYLTAAREITAAAGALLVLDEVQTGIGRTGHWFAAQAEGVEADVVTLAKGLGGGLPIGATLAFGEAAGLLTPGTHGSTFSGNPVVCAAALAVLATIADTGLLERVRRTGERLRRGIEDLRHPLVEEVRGAGLLLGVVLSEDVAPRVQQAAQEAGLLVNAAAPDVIRLAPPLILSDDNVDLFLLRLPGVLRAADAMQPAAG
ncbi:Acetylornithine/succinyldiaminopimelate aminotransferase [Streptomyces alboniger]